MIIEKIKMQKNCEYRKGLTLVENLIAIMVVSIVLISILQIYNYAVVQTNVSRHRVMATNLAQAKLENIINEGYGDINTADYPMEQNVVIDPGVNDGTSDDLSGKMTTTLTNFNTDEGYRVTVTVQWNEPIKNSLRTMSERLEVLITPYG